MTEATELDLSPALHDAVLRRVRSDPFGCRAILGIENHSLNEFYGYGDGAIFELQFSGVESLIVLVARDHVDRVAADARSQRRMESASWTQFEQTFNDAQIPNGIQFKTGRYEIIQSHLMVVPDRFEFIIDEFVDYAGFTSTQLDLLCEIRIESNAVGVICPGGQVRTIEEFIKLGEAFWEWLQRSAKSERRPS